jgi:hypothetical protein
MNALTGSGTVGDIPVYDGGTPATDIVNSSLSDPVSLSGSLTTTDEYVDIKNTLQVPGYRFNGITVLQNAGSNNIFAGVGAGNLSVSGGKNTVVGFDALNGVTSGQDNTVVGHKAMLSNTVGSSNTAVGSYALQANTSNTNNNTAAGLEAMYTNSTGENNTAVGDVAMYYNTSGHDNTAIGEEALDSNVAGANNVAVGAETAMKNAGTSDNVAVGTGALAITNKTGSDLTIAGEEADVDADGYTDAAAIGAGAVTTGSYHIQLGDKYIAYLNTAGAITTGMAQSPAGPPGEIIFGGRLYTSTFTVSTFQSGDLNYTLPGSQPRGIAFMADNGSGTLSWTSVVPGNLAAVTATSPVASSGGINPTLSLTAGSHNTFLTTNNSGVVGFNPLDVDGTTLKGDGSNTALAINLANANTWTATQTFTPTTNNAGAVVRQTSAGSPTADIFDVQNNAGSTTYLDVNSAGNIAIPPFSSAGIVHNNASGVLSSSLVSMTSDVTGILPIANGGTNYSTALSGSSIMISNGSAILQGAAGTTTTVLHGNASGAPSYSAVNLTSDVTNTLPFTHGGTGVTSTPTNGKLLIGNGTGYTLATLTAGTGGITIGNTAGNITLTGTGAGTGLITDLTLMGDGVSSNVGIDLTHANTWTNKVTISPSSGIDAQALIVNQTLYSGGMPTTDIMDVNTKTGMAMAVDVSGNFKIGNSTTPINSHILSDGTHGLVSVLKAGAINAGSAGDDISGLVTITGGGAGSNGNQFWVRTSGVYTGGSAVVVVASGASAGSGALEPYGYFDPNAGGPGVPGIVIGTSGAPGAGNSYSFAYHVIHLQ